MILLYDQWVVLAYEGTKAKTPKIKNLATVSDFLLMMPRAYKNTKIHP